MEISRASLLSLGPRSDLIYLLVTRTIRETEGPPRRDGLRGGAAQAFALPLSRTCSGSDASTFQRALLRARARAQAIILLIRRRKETKNHAKRRHNRETPRRQLFTAGGGFGQHGLR